MQCFFKQTLIILRKYLNFNQSPSLCIHCVFQVKILSSVFFPNKIVFANYYTYFNPVTRQQVLYTGLQYGINNCKFLFISELDTTLH